jgi:hypothetical protein
MKQLVWLCLLVLMIVPAPLFAGDIQVACEPGLRVFLDGKLAGTSNAKEDGLFMANVPEGAHVIRVERDGFVPQSYQVEVATLPIEVRVGAFLPAPLTRKDAQPDRDTAKQPGGKLLVTSAPQECVVEIDGKAENKSVPILLVEGLAAGEHTIAFSKPGYEPISGVVTIRPGVEVTVRGDLIGGKVETVHEGMGSLRVYSTPAHCTARFAGITRETANGVFNFSYIPAGEHRLVVEWKGRRLATNVVIAKGQRTVVTVSFMKGDQPFVVSYKPE